MATLSQLITGLDQTRLQLGAPPPWKQNLKGALFPHLSTPFHCNIIHTNSFFASAEFVFTLTHSLGISLEPNGKLRLDMVAAG